MIVPITIALAIFTSRKAENTGSFSFSKIFPWFIFGFIFASIVNTIGFLPSSLCLTLAQIGKFFIVMAMVAIGLNTYLKQLIGNGIKPIFLGLSCWIAVAIVSLAVQQYLHIW
jgi:uncharacterized membrane protein YadS